MGREGLFHFIQFMNENWVSMVLRIFVTREKGAENIKNLVITLKMDFLGQGDSLRSVALVLGDCGRGVFTG